MPNMTYVEPYLVNVERDLDGWPKGTSAEEKKWLTSGVTAILRRRQSGITIMEIHDHLRTLAEHSRLFGDPVDVPKLPGEAAFRNAALWDYRLALVHRALLAAGASLVWRF